MLSCRNAGRFAGEAGIPTPQVRGDRPALRRGHRERHAPPGRSLPVGPPAGGRGGRLGLHRPLGHRPARDPRAHRGAAALRPLRPAAGPAAAAAPDGGAGPRRRRACRGGRAGGPRLPRRPRPGGRQPGPRHARPGAPPRPRPEPRRSRPRRAAARAACATRCRPGCSPLRQEIARRALSWGCYLSRRRPGGHQRRHRGASTCACWRCRAQGTWWRWSRPPSTGRCRRWRPGAKVVEVPCLPDVGMDLDELERRIDRHGVRAVLAVPDLLQPAGQLHARAGAGAAGLHRLAARDPAHRGRRLRRAGLRRRPPAHLPRPSTGTGA